MRETLHKELADLHREGMAVRVRLLAEAEPTSYERMEESIVKLLLPSYRKETGTKAKARSPEARKKEANQLLAEFKSKSFGATYQNWYTKALPVIEQLLPDRYVEFRELHRLDKIPKELDPTTYTISDFIRGVFLRDVLGNPIFDAGSVAAAKLQNQVDILGSVKGRLESALGDITGVIEADLLDDELSTSRGLLKAKHLRSAGIVAGVVLERHLKRLIANHGVSFRKVQQIANMNDALKEAKVYDVPTWRQIQRLGDLRNLCGHDKERLPTTDEVDELISGVEKVTMTVF